MVTARGSRGSLALALVMSFSLAAANECCPNETVYMKQLGGCGNPEGGSTDFVPRNVNCSEGVYLVNPTWDHDGEFTVLEDGHLQIGKNEVAYLVPPQRFCVTRAQLEKDNPKNLHRVAFVCFPGDAVEEHDNNSFWWIFYGILQAISIVFLFVTLSVYILLPELRDLQGRCIMSTVLCLMLGYLFLSGIQFKGHQLVDTPCLVAAFFLYFWMLASFFWLSVNSFNVWRVVWYQRFPLSDMQLFWCYCAFGWLCPFVFLVAALTTHHMPITEDVLLRPNFGLNKCWFDGDTETIAYFYGPISLLLAVNLGFFLMTALRLWRRGEGDNAVPGIHASRFKCLLYLKIFVIMGMLWIFEVISFLIKGTDGFWRITDIINCLQGALIFLAVVCRRRVVIALMKRDWGRSVVSVVCPRWCTTGPDAEQGEAMLNCAGDDEAYVPMDSAGREQT